MNGQVGGPRGCQNKYFDGTQGADWQGLAADSNSSDSEKSLLVTAGVYASTVETLASTISGSSPVYCSPFPAVTALSVSVVESLETEQDTLTTGPCSPYIGAAAPATLFPVVVSVTATGVPCEALDDTSPDMVAAAAAEVAVDASAKSPALTGGFAVVPLICDYHSPTAAAEPPAASFVAGADLSMLKGALGRAPSADAEKVGLGEPVDPHMGMAEGKTTDLGSTNMDTTDEEAAGTSEGARAASTDTSDGAHAGNSTSSMAGVGQLLRQFSQAALPQWWCSSTSKSKRLLSCTAAVVDSDTELQGSEAEAAAGAHMAALSAASVDAFRGSNATRCPHDHSDSEEGVSPTFPQSPRAMIAAVGSGVKVAAAMTQAGTGTDTTTEAHSVNFDGPLKAHERNGRQLGVYGTGRDEPPFSRSSTGGSETWSRSLSSEAEELLQLLQERAARAGGLSDCCCPAQDAETGGSRAAAADPRDAQGLLLQLTRLQEATDAVVAAGREALEREQEGLDDGSSEAAAAATIARAQRVLQQQKQTVWTSLLGSIAESSRRSVEAVQRAAGTAVAGAADRALDSLVLPLIGACRAPTTHLHEGDDYLPPDVVFAEGGNDEENVQTRTRSSEQVEPLPEVTNPEPAPQGLLLELQRRQHAIAEELRQRSNNLLQHSRGLTTSSTLSEARYHLAEIVDTGGPEVSGVWAGFKVGVGIFILASGHLLLGGAMVAAATGSLGSAIMWGRHRQLFYEMMRGEFRGNEQESEPPANSDASGPTAASSDGVDETTDGSKESSNNTPLSESYTTEEVVDAVQSGSTSLNNRREHEQESMGASRSRFVPDSFADGLDSVLSEGDGAAIPGDKNQLNMRQSTEQTARGGLKELPSSSLEPGNMREEGGTSSSQKCSAFEESSYVDCDDHVPETTPLSDSDVAGGDEVGYGSNAASPDLRDGSRKNLDSAAC